MKIQIEKILEENKIFYDLIKKSGNSQCIHRVIAPYLAHREDYKYCLDCDITEVTPEHLCYMDLGDLPIMSTYKLAKVLKKNSK